MKGIIGLFFVAMIAVIEISVTAANVESGCVGFKCRFQNSALNGFETSMAEPVGPNTIPIMSGPLKR